MATPIRGDSVSIISNTGNVNLNGGAGANLDASIEVPQLGTGDITISTPLGALILTEGSGSDAFIIADNGANALNFDACSTCVAIAIDPRGNGTAETGVVASNFPVAISWDGQGADGEWTTAANWAGTRVD